MSGSRIEGCSHLSRTPHPRLIMMAVSTCVLSALFTVQHATCTKETRPGIVSVRFVDSLVAGVPNKLLVRAFPQEDVDTATLLITAVERGVRRKKIAIWSGRLKPADSIVAEYPIPALGLGDYRYVADLEYQGFTQLSGALCARLTEKGTCWTQGDLWELDLAETEAEIKRRGFGALTLDSIAKIAPEMRHRLAKLKVYRPVKPEGSDSTTRP